MSNERITDMVQRQIIKLHSEGMSRRKISRMLGVHRRTIKEYLELYEDCTVPLEDLLDPQSDIIKLLGIRPPEQKPSARKIQFDEFIEQHEKKRQYSGFTIENLYGDYQQHFNDQTDLYSRAQFYRLIDQAWHAPKGSLKLNHIYGDAMYVDYTGKTLQLVDPQTGEVIKQQVLVVILPASQYIYVEAMASQKQHDFINGVINAMEFFGGVPQRIVTDNLKSAVTKASKNGKVINKAFQAMAEHYQTTIDPTRSYKPKDKALVEGAVKICYQSIYYELQKHTFFSLQDLNSAIKAQLEKLNNKQLSNRDHSRKYLYCEEIHHLGQLPSQRHRLLHFTRAKVQKMGYIYCSNHRSYYSVPYRFIGKDVELRFDNRNLSIYYHNERIAHHQASSKPGHYVTIKDHLSANNQKYMEWSAEYFVTKSKSVGLHVSRYIESMIAQGKYPYVAYKSAQGIINLAKQYSDQRVDKACQLAADHPHHSYKMIKEILENKMDLQEDFQAEYSAAVIPVHDNIRGSDYYA